MNDKIGIYDHATGKSITRELTDKEQSERNLEIRDALLAKEQENAEAKIKADAKAAILDRIGLTADELKTILG
jgi:hypothetical protein